MNDDESEYLTVYNKWSGFAGDQCSPGDVVSYFGYEEHHALVLRKREGRKRDLIFVGQAYEDDEMAIQIPIDIPYCPDIEEGSGACWEWPGDDFMDALEKFNPALAEQAKKELDEAWDNGEGN